MELQTWEYCFKINVPLMLYVHSFQLLNFACFRLMKAKAKAKPFVS